MICKPDQSGSNFEKRIFVLTAKEKQLKVSFKLLAAKAVSAAGIKNTRYKVSDNNYAKTK
jgi:hypothetical protein